MSAPVRLARLRLPRADRLVYWSPVSWSAFRRAVTHPIWWAEFASDDTPFEALKLKKELSKR